MLTYATIIPPLHCISQSIQAPNMTEDKDPVYNVEAIGESKAIKGNDKSYSAGLHRGSNAKSTLQV